MDCTFDSTLLCFDLLTYSACTLSTHRSLSKKKRQAQNRKRALDDGMDKELLMDEMDMDTFAPEHIRFGDIADRPPELTFRPKQVCVCIGDVCQHVVHKLSRAHATNTHQYLHHHTTTRIRHYVYMHACTPLHRKLCTPIHIHTRTHTYTCTQKKQAMRLTDIVDQEKETEQELQDEMRGQRKKKRKRSERQQSNDNDRRREMEEREDTKERVRVSVYY